MQKELHELRARNIAIRDDSNKFRKQSKQASEHIRRIEAELESMTDANVRSLK